jgi:hypothetical protein
VRTFFRQTTNENIMIFVYVGRYVCNNTYVREFSVETKIMKVTKSVNPHTSLLFATFRIPNDQRHNTEYRVQVSGKRSLSLVYTSRASESMATKNAQKDTDKLSRSR